MNKRIVLIISGVMLVLGCVTLGCSLFAASVLPTAFRVYLTGMPVGYSHEILHPDMTTLYIFSTIEIACGLMGVFFFGVRAKD